MNRLTCIRIHDIVLMRSVKGSEGCSLSFWSVFSKLALVSAKGHPWESSRLPKECSSGWRHNGLPSPTDWSVVDDHVFLLPCPKEYGIIPSNLIFSVAQSWPFTIETTSSCIKLSPDVPASFRSWWWYCWVNAKWYSIYPTIEGCKNTVLPLGLANFSVNVPGVVCPT